MSITSTNSANTTFPDMDKTFNRTSFDDMTNIGQQSEPTRAAFEISLELFNECTFVVNVILTPIICTIGLCGNGVGLFVMWHDFKYQKQSIYRYMFALMAFDNVYLLVGLAIGIVSIIQVYNWDLANWLLMHMTFVTGFLDVVSYHTTSILLMAMALERLSALLRPLAMKQTLLYRYPVHISVIIFLIFAVLILPFPAGVEIIEQTYMNRTILNIQSRAEFVEFLALWHRGETIISTIYPVLMLIFNIAIPIAYCRYLHRRSNLTSGGSSDTQQLRITIMVLWVTILYMLLAVPKIFLQVIILFVDKAYDHDGIHSLTFYLFTFVGDLFARVNAANDFLVYVLVSERYRKILYVLFTRCWSKQNEYKKVNDIFRHAANNFSNNKSEKQKTYASVTEKSESVPNAT